MNTQPEALRLADSLENWPDLRVDLQASAAELRRLQAIVDKYENGILSHFAEQPAQQVKPLTDDTLRLDALDQNCWDLRCFSHSSGEDYGWRVIEHHMAKPHERTVAEVYSNDPRKAIDAAIEASRGIK